MTYGRTTGVDTVLATVPGTLWVEETGGIVTLRHEPAPARPTFSTTEAGAATAIDRAFAIAAARPRIARLYVYEWQAYNNDPFDAGLVRPDGVARPSLAALQRNLAALGSSAARATTTAAPVTWKATWSKKRRRQVVLRATCRTTVVRCTGKVTAALRTRPAGAASATFARVASRRAYQATTAQRTVSVRITLSAKAYRRARRAPTRRVVLTVAATRPSVATSKATVTPARPG
ncbi:MAG TPA: hypothetical protein VNT55_15755 [Baekduia sp.]|nr:hypothetical protein [Baekduia sp.]